MCLVSRKTSFFLENDHSIHVDREWSQTLERFHVVNQHNKTLFVEGNAPRTTNYIIHGNFAITIY